jgi:hypothetical protein
MAGQHNSPTGQSLSEAPAEGTELRSYIQLLLLANSTANIPTVKGILHATVTVYCVGDLSLRHN